MEKFMKPRDKESMRLAILEHEETFREQVCELHRLYQAQKILMRNIQSKKHTEEHQEKWNLFRRERFIQTLDHDETKHKPEMRRFLLERSAQVSITDFCDNRFVEESQETIEETEIKLTLGPSSYLTRKKTERKLTSESMQS